MIVPFCSLLMLALLAQANASGQCVMRGNCGVDDLTLLNKPCAFDGPPSPLKDPKAIATMKNMCPSLDISDDFSVCCDASQVEMLSAQLSVLATLFKRCPSCYHNLANLFCNMVCSPTQNSYLQVTTVGKNNSVDAIDYYITEKYTTGLFDSCRNVRLGDTSTKVIEIACGAHAADCSPHNWLDYMGSHDPSPNKINFQYETASIVTVDGTSFYPMNATIIPCSQAVRPGGSACSCVDCPCDT